MATFRAQAGEIVSRCRRLASYSEDPGFLTRTFLSPPMRDVHADLGNWMKQAGMTVRVDNAGNIRGSYAGTNSAAPLIIGSHLDTVPHAGAFDGPLGVLLGIALIEMLGDRRLSFPIEVIGFSEEEGVRFGLPFIGSRALIGEIDPDLLARKDSKGVSVQAAIRNFGLDPARIGDAATSGGRCLEFHIEQGPVLETLDLPLGIVNTIVGQSRVELRFKGKSNHAGTTPMNLRLDALAGAAEWIQAVEQKARATADLVATVGQIEAKPGAGNVIPGEVTLSLDVRHPSDAVRREGVKALLDCARQIASRRRLEVSSEHRLDQPSVAMDAGLTSMLAQAVEDGGYPVYRMNSGAGHDAMIMARRMPAAMLFLRSPGGISHHPDESVLTEDVAAALDAGTRFLSILETSHD